MAIKRIAKIVAAMEEESTDLGNDTTGLKFDLWKEKMAGRRLENPKITKKRVTLPEFLKQSAKYAKSRCVPKALEGRRDSKEFSSRPSSKQMSVVKPFDAQLLAFGVQDSLGPRPISQELDLKRQMHPRLRWPRLQRPATDPVVSLRGTSTASCSAFDEDEFGDHNLTGILRCDELSSACDEGFGYNFGEDFQDILQAVIDEEAQSKGIVIGPGSVFFSGSEEPLAFPWPPFNGISDSVYITGVSGGHHSQGQSQDLWKPMTATTNTSATSSMAALGFEFASTSISSASSSNILRPAKPYKAPITGSTSTLHNTPLQRPSLHIGEDLGMLSCFLGVSESAGGSRSSKRTKSRQSSKRDSSQERLLLKGPLVEDEKWFLRQAPVSCVMARNARPPAKDAQAQSEDNGRRNSSADKAQASLFLDFESWGLDDDYLDSLLTSALPADLSRIRRLNLADNRLTEHSIAILISSACSLSALKAMNLSGNHLAERGCRGILTFLQDARPKLSELDLGGNDMGDQVCEELCKTLSRIMRYLKVLGLSRNKLGQTNQAGIALGALVSDLQDLNALDLHWNQLHGDGATAFCHGLYDNSCVIGGKLRRVDLSWNRLGLECGGSLTNSSLDKALCQCLVCAASRRTVKMLASVFQEGKTLFHMDLSYNTLSTLYCGILADGLRKNHSLFGLHLMGNAAFVDDLGFVVPRQGLSASADAQWQELDYEREMNRMAHPVSPKLKKVSAGRNFNAQDNGTAHNFLSGGHCWESTQSSVDRCWICESWCKRDVCYMPGLSGQDDNINDITSVYCYFSIDGFQKPTILKRSEDAYCQKLFEGRITAHSNPRIERRNSGLRRKAAGGKRDAIGHVIPRLPDGKILRFVGSRALPPSCQDVDVVFQVNGGPFVAAVDLPKRKLQKPKAIVRNPLVADAGRRRSQDFNSNGDVKSSGVLNAEQSAVMTITEVNVLKFSSTVLDSGLLVLEDSTQRGNMSVYPRRVLDGSAKMDEAQWSFESSSFQGFSRDRDELACQCFDGDWNLSKLRIFSKEPLWEGQLMSYMRPRYEQLMAAFHQFAFSRFSDRNRPLSLSLVAFKELLMQYDVGSEGAGYLFDGEVLAHDEVDTIYVVANVFADAQVESQEKKRTKDYKAVSEKGLSRFQFLEAFVRVIYRRFIESGEVAEPEDAMEEFLDTTKFGEDALELRRSLHACLFTEECCLVYRENKSTLDLIYERYKKVAGYPGRPGKFTYGAWHKLLEDADAAECGLTQKSFGLAFALGKELRVDEFTSYRHMELSLQEFYVCLGALVRLRDDFERDFFGDMLSDLFSQKLLEMVHSHVGDGPGRGLPQHGDSWSNIISLVGRVFADADEDGNGSLNVREFRRCLNQPSVLQQIHQEGIEVGDFNVFFSQLDSDRSGEVTLEEFCEGMIKTQLRMKGMTRSVAYLRRVYIEKDADGNGVLDLEEFKAMCSDPSVIKKLQAMGIAADEPETLFEDMVAECAYQRTASDGPRGVTADHMISVFLRMRDPDLGSQRALNFLRQVFAETDTDCKGFLTKEEYRSAFVSERVSQRLTRLGLKVPDWVGIFEALDIDGDGELTIDELVQGTKTIWEADLELRMKEQLECYSLSRY